MAQIWPFRALRPHKAYVESVAAPPYDVLSLEEARVNVKGNPLSFLHVEKSEIDFPAGTDMHNVEVSQKARANLEKLMKDGILFQDEVPCFYIYRQQMGSHVQYGLVACVSAVEYDAGLIKKHELTREARERERIRHVEMVNAQTGPIFITYRNKLSVDRIISDVSCGVPEYDFIADDEVRHTVWIISEQSMLQSLRHEFSMVDALYIADGHHRAAAAAAVARSRRALSVGGRSGSSSDKMLAVLFPDNQLKILAYNRVIRNLNRLTEEEFLNRIEGYFNLSDGFVQKSPQHSHEFGMYLPGRWFCLQTINMQIGSSDPVHSLDVDILQKRLLTPILGIGDPRTDQRIDFVGGIRDVAELERLVNHHEYVAAFTLFPTSVDQVMAVADAGKIMPPKSTWFEPKLRSGIFVHLLG
jgi:uncharacterized protein (DUF1015 family)